MDEELKNELLETIKQLKDGAPEAWSVLIAEHVSYGYMQISIALISIVASCVAIALGCRMMNYHFQEEAKPLAYQNDDRSFAMMAGGGALFLMALLAFCFAADTATSGLYKISCPATCVIQSIR